MIGFFDSGVGGLTILREAIRLLPQYSYMYLSDNSRAPYGSRSTAVIYQFTLDGVQRLFDNGAELIILACNTASSAALRRIQQEFLPKHFPDKRVLGIVIPTVEEIGDLSRSGKVGILATEATVSSLAYVEEVRKLYPDVKVYQQACPLLVPIIESGEVEWEGLDLAIKKYLNELLAKEPGIDTIVLGCTHYAIIENNIKIHLNGKVKLVSQGTIVARKLKDYLARHPEIERRIRKGGERKFFTTETSPRIKHLSRLFYNEPIEIETMRLD